MELIKPFTIEREDYCINCGSKKSLELYNIYDKPLKYSNLLDFGSCIDINEIFDKTNLGYIKCKRCGKTYMLEWNKNKLRPMNTNIFYNQFMSNFGT